MIETLLISTLIIAIAMVFFLVSEAMKERGIHCVMDQDREMQQKSKFAIDEH